MNSDLNLLERIKKGPLYLFLGQKYLKSYGKSDSFLNGILEKYSQGKAEGNSYKDILNTKVSDNNDSSLAWIQSLGIKISPPEELGELSKLPWSGVFTSCIDNIWWRCFAKPWRVIQPIFEEKFKPLNPRSKFNLHILFLYGCVDRSETSQTPPLKKLDYSKQKPEALSLLGRLPEYLTPVGTLVVDAYDDKFDWLEIEDFYSILSALSENQVFFFNTPESLIGNEYFADLVKRGIVNYSKKSSYSFFSEFIESGEILKGVEFDEFSKGKKISINGKKTTMPVRITNSSSAHFNVLHDGLLNPVSRISKDKEFLEYRNFLGNISSKFDLDGFKRNFNFKRDYEEDLQKQVKLNLDRSGISNEPIILTGQTGSGKTVALSRLAYEVLKEGRFPVVYLSKNIKYPNLTQLDHFSKWIEDEGANKVLVIWDGMVDYNQYVNALKYLSGRGRKVLIVGSTYLERGTITSKNFIVADAKLKDTEKLRFSAYLNKIDPTMTKMLNGCFINDEYFLVALYRLLPSTRAQLRTGVACEIEFAEKLVDKKLQSQSAIFNNSLGNALLRARIIDGEKLSKEGVFSLCLDGLGNIKTIFGLIVVPGKFGLEVPIELLLRTVAKGKSIEFTKLIEDVDIFRWTEDNNGNIFITTRTSLEGRLLADCLLGQSQTEIDFAKQLLLEVRDNEDFGDGNEINFAIELIRNLGPHGENSGKYCEHFIDLSETLTQLREERGVTNSRIMLQEASLLREAVVEKVQKNKPLENPLEALDKAESILNEALHLIPPHKKSTLTFFYVEKAALLATKLRYLLDSSNCYAEHIYESITSLAWQTHSYTEDYIPLDVVSWLGPYLIAKDSIPDDTKLRIKADVLFAFDLADSDNLNTKQFENLQSRKQIAYATFGENTLSDEAFESLKSIGSCAGYYIKAFEITGTLPTNKFIDKVESTKVNEAFELLDKNYSYIKKDVKVLYLLLKLWWFKKTGHAIFFKERQCVPFDHESWTYLNKITNDLKSHHEMEFSPTVNFLHAIALFHLGFLDDSFQVFKDLESFSDSSIGRRRLIKSHLYSSPNGTPRVFSGEVNWTEPDRNKGNVYVPEIRKNIMFSPREFGQIDFAKSESLGNFHIGFNFRGALADPVERYK